MTDQYHKWITERLENVGEQWVDFKLPDEQGRWFWTTTMRMLLTEIDAYKKELENIQRDSV